MLQEEQGKLIRQFIKAHPPREPQELTQVQRNNINKRLRKTINQNHPSPAGREALK